MQLPPTQPTSSSSPKRNRILHIEVFQIQLEKLAVNAFCNPLCALNNAKNGFLFTLPEVRRAILKEISAVVLALPELRNVPGVRERLAVERLEATVNRILTQTAETTCSMVWDLRAGRKRRPDILMGIGYEGARRLE